MCFIFHSSNGVNIRDEFCFSETHGSKNEFSKVNMMHVCYFFTVNLAILARISFSRIVFKEYLPH